MISTAMAKNAYYIAVCYRALFLLLAYSTTVESESVNLCNGATNDMTDTCGLLSADLERSLLYDQGNLFRMRRAFFHSPTAAPVLLKVVYSITYSDNITQSAAMEEMPYCVIITNDGERLVSDLNTSAVTPNQTIITLGWTAAGIYTVLHPSVLNIIQVQTAFTILRAFHRTLQGSHYTPEADAFFWTGGDNLPTLYLDLSVENLSCVPSKELLKSVLEDLNTLIMVYGGQQDTHAFEPEIKDIGFTLSISSVTAEGISEKIADIILSVFYPLLMSVLYIILLQSAVTYYYPKHKAQINLLLKNNAELVSGVALTAVVINAIEIPIRIVNTFFWTSTTYAADSLGTFLTVWLPQIFIFGIVVFANIYYHIKFIVQRPHTQKVDVNGVGCGVRCYDSILNLFLPNIALHVILVTFLFLFFFLYGIFPGFLLLFAYPVQVVSMLSLVVAFVFAMIVFSAIIVKIYKRSVSKPRIVERKKTVKFILLRFIPFFVGMTFLQLMAFLLLYSLIIGRGPVVSSQPLFILTLLPSALLSGVSWAAKRTLVDGKKRPLDNIDALGLKTPHKMTPDREASSAEIG